MAFNPLTDFVGLLRATAGGVRAVRMPGLDYALAALSRAGLCSLSVGASAPTSNQATTVWLQPATPSWSAEGTVFLWNTTAGQYQPATPFLWSAFLCATFIALIPSPSNTEPQVDGAGAPGVLTSYSRADHQHPSDPSRAPLASPVLTGNPQAPTPTFGDNSTSIATTAFVQETAGVIPPIGSVLPYSANTAPSGSWVLAQGQAISRTTYATLFGLVGITYGSGDGVTTFNVPDLRGRVVAGVDGGANRLTTASQSSQSLAGNGGTESVTLSSSQIPAHTHPNTLNDPSHSHTHNASINNAQGPASSGSLVFGQAATINANTTGITITNNANTGGGGSHLNVQPTMQLQYILRVA